jgi:hypothetical protein
MGRSSARQAVYRISQAVLVESARDGDEQEHQEQTRDLSGKDVRQKQICRDEYRA